MDRREQTAAQETAAPKAAAEKRGRGKASRVAGAAGRILKKALGALLCLIGLAGVYFVLVLAQPQDRAEQAQKAQALPAAPTREISSEGELRELAKEFPGPVMSFLSGSGMAFVSGKLESAPWEKGYGRILTLYWQTREGVPVTMRSIWPDEALDLMGRGDYRFSDTAGPTLFGISSVRMENAETIRVHAQAAGQGLYVLNFPRSLRSSLASICRSAQLFSAE